MFFFITESRTQYIGKNGSIKNGCFKEKERLPNISSNFKHFILRRNFNGQNTDNFSLGDLIFFIYASIILVDIELSFSIFNVLLADNIKNFQFENFEKTSYSSMSFPS